MRVGILSDTHNDSTMTQRALLEFRQRGVNTLFHCGDLTSSEMIQHFQGFNVFFVRGNMDRHQTKALKSATAAQPGAHWLGKGDTVGLEGKLIAIVHGDREKVLETLLLAEPDYVFTGHTHRRRDQRVGRTRIINPGALGGVNYEARSIGILDLTSDQLDVICL